MQAHLVTTNLRASSLGISWWENDMISIYKLRSMPVKVGLLNIFSIQNNETQVGDYMQKSCSILADQVHECCLNSRERANQNKVDLNFTT